MKKFFSSEHNLFPILALGFLSLVWGSSFILMKKGLEAFSPIQVGTLRVLFSFIVLFPIAIRESKKYLKIYWKKMLILGLASNLIPAILFSKAETGLSSSLAGILNALTPLFTLIIGAMFFNISFKGKQTFGLIVGLIGSIGISFIGSKGEIGDFNHFALYVILATILYGTAGNYLKKEFSDINATALTSITFMLISPIALIGLFSTNFIDVLQNNPEAYSSLGYIFLLGAIGTALALLLFYRVIMKTTAVFASTVTYVIPIVAVIWGLLDGEEIHLLHFVGMVFIILGVYFVNKYK